MSARSTKRSRARGQRHLALLLLVGPCVLYVLYLTVQLHNPALLNTEPGLIDFHAFYAAGSLALDGRYGNAYRTDQLLRALTELTPDATPMTWTYPPPFGIVVAGLALLPLPVSYLVFALVSFGAYLLVLRRLAGEHLPILLTALLPALLLNIHTGQNGFLTGTLIGLFALLALRGSLGAGVPLGLMVIKPHLGLGLGLLAVFSGWWRWLLQAVGVALAAALVSTLVFGLDIWRAFLDAIGQAGDVLERGAYRLFRMTSAYAVVRSMGADASFAYACQSAVALYATGALFVAVRQRWPMRRLLAISIMATQLMSPYSYDYDLVMFGVGLALVIREMAPVLSERARLWSFVAMWFMTGYGPLSVGVADSLGQDSWLGAVASQVSLSGLVYLVLFTLTFRVLGRLPPTGAERQPQPASG